jgi:hypothetical protein
METQMGENHIMLSYISKITFIGSTNFQILQHQLEGGSNPLKETKEATTPYILQLQLEGGSNPLFTGSNLKEAPTPYVLQLQLAPTNQPPFLTPSFHPKI